MKIEIDGFEYDTADLIAMQELIDSYLTLLLANSHPADEVRAKEALRKIMDTGDDDSIIQYLLARCQQRGVDIDFLRNEQKAGGFN